MRAVEYLSRIFSLSESPTVTWHMHFFPEAVNEDGNWISPDPTHSLPDHATCRLFYGFLSQINSPESLVDGLYRQEKGKNIFQRLQFEMSLTPPSAPAKVPFLGLMLFLRIMDVLGHYAIAETKKKHSLGEKKQQILDFFEGCFNKTIISYPVKYEKTGLVTSFSSVFRNLELSLINIIGKTEDAEIAWKIVEGACLLSITAIENKKIASWEPLQKQLLPHMKKFLTVVQREWLQAYFDGKKKVLSDGTKMGLRSTLPELLREGLVETKPFEMPPVVRKQLRCTTTTDVMKLLNNIKEQPLVYEVPAKKSPTPSAPPLEYWDNEIPTPPLTPENRSRNGSEEFGFPVAVAERIPECIVEGGSYRDASLVVATPLPRQSIFSKDPKTGATRRNVIESSEFRDPVPSAPSIPVGGFSRT